MFFGRDFLFTWNPKVMKEVLIKNMDNWEKWTNLGKTFEDLAGDSLFVANGERWKQQSRILKPCFHHEHIRSQTNIFCRITDKLCDRLEELAISTKQFEPYAWMSKVTLDALGESIFLFFFCFYLLLRN